MKFTTNKLVDIECYGANGVYNVRVPQGTALTVHTHLRQPILLEERRIKRSTYYKHYAPPKKVKAQTDKED